MNSDSNPAANAPANPDGTHTVNKPVSKDPTTKPDDLMQTRRDNTAVNERDQNSGDKTPFDQGNNKEDIRITSEIRQKIVNHEGMSINARNVKIITAGGMVTLRGPVNSQDEKNTIEKFAKDVATNDKVNSELEVAP
ncbi:BON domain-containing protein [Anatilimnocola floriformis]|uniref:BON domain-containing protein n=1 Tax=Anatilimnocola floriformis TaxID=2948575 RepID=UPI0020C41BF5|nr:BON domain-containing protein [Anatilimnocola floriformis]